MSNTLEGFNAHASSFNADHEFAFWLHVWMSVGLFLSVVGPMIYFAWKYRADKVKNEDIGTLTHHTGLELAWTIIPIIAVMVFFYYGNTTLQMFRTLPTVTDETIVIKVEGSKWKWKYEYPANKSGYVHKIGGAYKKPTIDKDTGKIIEEGTMGITALYVPANTDVILEMTAPVDDVIHSFYIPAFRMKEDVVPGRTTKQWFNASKVGEYDVECAEYCGTDHSYMYSRLVVLPQAEYDAWFNSTENTPKGNYAKGGDALVQRHGCTQCHAIETDKVIVGPSLKNRLSKEQVLDVINHGQDQLGYDMGAMPAGLVAGADAEEIAAYVAGGMKGEKPASFAACASCHGDDGKGMGGMSPNLVGYDAALISHVFKNGKKGMIGQMPAYPDMTEEEISTIAEYLDNAK
jgi:cytochrome c oxidase subunit 2